MEATASSEADLLDEVRRAEVPPGSVALWYTGGAGYIVKSVETTMLIDPFVGPSNPPNWIRAIPPAFDPERLDELGPIAAVLLTHEHGDHADPDALRPLSARSEAVVVGPASCITVAQEAGYPADRCRVLEHHHSLLAGNIHVTAVPMHDPGAKGCNGYVLETDHIAILHAGDSLYFPGFLDLGKRWSFDAICVSVAANPPGRGIYMDEADAARAARDAGTSMLIPQHYDLWQGLTLDPQRIAIAASWYCPDTRVVPARFGRRITIG
jgi:L-ascorbate metabolism protein UlaG (beta-lactamase superfamily)